MDWAVQQIGTQLLLVLVKVRSGCLVLLVLFLAHTLVVSFDDQNISCLQIIS